MPWRRTRKTDLDAVPGAAGLVHGCLHFDPADKPTATLTGSRRSVRDDAPDLAVHVVEQTTRMPPPTRQSSVA